MATEWRIFNGLLAHAVGRRYKGERDLRPICGANRYTWARRGHPMKRGAVKCIRCLRILGLKTPKRIRQRIELINLEKRRLHAALRRG